MSVTFATQYPPPPSFPARSRSGPRTLRPSIYQVRGEGPQFGLDWATCSTQICLGKSDGLWSGPARSCVQWSLRACSRQSDARPGSPSGKDMRPDYQEHSQLTATSCPLLQDMPQLSSLIAHVPFLGGPRAISEQGCGPKAQRFCPAPDSSPRWAMPKTICRETTPLPTQTDNARLPSHRSHWAACLTLFLGLPWRTNTTDSSTLGKRASLASWPPLRA